MMNNGFAAVFLAVAVASLGCVATSDTAAAQSLRPKPRPELAAAPPIAEPEAIRPELAEAPAETAPEQPQVLAALSVAAPRPATTTPANQPPDRDPNRGAVTNLPLPRYVSLKTGEGNARRGPGLTHRIDWVFNRAGMPLKITAEYENWRRVEDVDGLGGWVHYSLLSGVRSVIVKSDLAEFHNLPSKDAPVLFKAEAGVVAKVMSCENDWCRLQIEGERGWAPVADLWGVTPGEAID